MRAISWAYGAGIDACYYLCGVNPLASLLQRYHSDHDRRTKRIQQAIDGAQPARLHLEGLVGAQLAFVIGGLSQGSPRSHLIVAENKEEAAYLQNTLSNIQADRPVFFFPDSFKRPLYFDVLDANNVLQRTETVNQITQRSASNHLVVTYPEALFEQVVSPEVLNESRITIVKGEKRCV